MFNPYIRGWINYYGHFYKSALYPTLQRIDAFLVRWARRKFKPLRQRSKGAREWLARVIRTSPDLFAHWKLLHGDGRTLGAVRAERLTQTGSGKPRGGEILPRDPGLAAEPPGRTLRPGRRADRLVDDGRRRGIPSGHVLDPLWRLIEAHVMAAERLHTDDTTVPVLAAGKTDIARCWISLRDDRPFGGPGPPAAIFRYSHDRKGEHPQAHLALGACRHPPGGCL